MKFEEALASLREGKKIRIGECRCFFRLNGKFIVNYLDEIARIDQHEVLLEDWEIVE